MQQLLCAWLHDGFLSILLQGLLMALVCMLVYDERCLSYQRMSNRERKYKRKKDRWNSTNGTVTLFAQLFQQLGKMVLAVTDVHWKTKKKKL